MNIAIVGTNFISDRFAEATASVDGVHVSAVYSRKYDTGKAFAEKHGISTIYTDYSNLLSDKSVDAVYVASPTMCHAEQSVSAMRAGKHVLCEKMMAAELSDFLLMERTQRECGVVLLEAMRPAHDPAIGVIKEALSSLGKIRRASFEFCQYSSRYDRFKAGELTNAFDPRMKNSALADIGIYPLHVAVSLFGAPISVYGRSVFLDNGFEGQGIITLGYADMTASVTYSKITDSVNPSVIEGEYGSLTVDKMNAPTQICLCLRGKAPRQLKYAPVPNNMIHEIAAFRDMTEGKTDFTPYLAVTKITQTLVDEIYRAAHISDKFR